MCFGRSKLKNEASGFDLDYYYANRLKKHVGICKKINGAELDIGILHCWKLLLFNLIFDPTYFLYTYQTKNSKVLNLWTINK